MAHTTLISTATLAEQRQPDWVVVDCRFDLTDHAWGREQYLAAHIPGAVYASLNDDLAGPRSGTNGRHPLPSVEALAETFGRLGIAEGTQVIVYDQDAGLYAGRAWWSLRYLGHEAVALLDGGWAKWIAEGRPTSGGDERRPEARFTPHPKPGLVLDLEAVEARLNDPRTLLVDARGAERFEGRTEPLDRVAGHIPGAANHFYRHNVGPDGTFLPAADLRARFDALLGGRPAAEVVMYCGSGVSACHNLLAMEVAGLRGSRLYPGSWSEWSADPARPVETGAAGRKA